MLVTTAVSAVLGIGNAVCAVQVSHVSLRTSAARPSVGQKRFPSATRTACRTGRLLVRLTSDVSLVQQIVLFFSACTRAPPDARRQRRSAVRHQLGDWR